MGKRFILWGIVITVLAVCLTGCGAEEKKGDEKLKDIEFTVLGEENIPEELKQIIDEKKEKEFKITYQDGDFLYICVGYGKQETGGYSITINELYLTANAIHMDMRQYRNVTLFPSYLPVYPIPHATSIKNYRLIIVKKTLKYYYNLA